MFKLNFSSSMYPSIAVVNRYYPEHLGEEFCDVYENDIVKPRLEAKKSGDKILADAFKLSANSVFGKSNSEYSFLCDPLYTAKTTLTGQLSLTMLVEMLCCNIQDIKLLQANTDGITVIIPKTEKRKYWEICKEWEIITKLSLEYVQYKKMIIRNVNNYIAIDIDDNIKRKGLFKLHEEMRKSGEYYKAFNQGIVPIALSEYFLNDISIEETIKSEKNIYNFCKTFQASHGWGVFSENKDGNRSDESKTNRYFISNNGVKFSKIKESLKPKYDTKLGIENEEENEFFDSLKKIVNIKCIELLDNSIVQDKNQIELILDCDINSYRILNKYTKFLNYIFGVSTVDLIRNENKEFIEITVRKHWRIIDIEAGNLVTLFNKFEEKNIEDYDINYDYYIEECNKVIDEITGEKDRRENELRQQKEYEKKLKDLKNQQRELQIEERKRLRFLQKEIKEEEKRKRKLEREEKKNLKMKEKNVKIY